MADIDIDKFEEAVNQFRSALNDAGIPAEGLEINITSTIFDVEEQSATLVTSDVSPFNITCEYVAGGIKCTF